MSNKFIVYFLFFYSFNRQKYLIKKLHRPQNSSPTQIDLRTKRDFFPVAYGWKGDCSYKKSRSHHYVFPLKFSLARKSLHPSIQKINRRLHFSITTCFPTWINLDSLDWTFLRSSSVK